MEEAAYILGYSQAEILRLIQQAAIPAQVELARSHILDHTLTQRMTVVVWLHREVRPD